MLLLYKYCNIPNTEQYKHLPRTRHVREQIVINSHLPEKRGKLKTHLGKVKTDKTLKFCNWKHTECAEYLYQPKAPRLCSNVGKLTTFLQKHLKRTMITNRLEQRRPDFAVSFSATLLSRPSLLFSHSANSGGGCCGRVGAGGGEQEGRGGGGGVEGSQPSSAASDITARHQTPNRNWNDSVIFPLSKGKRALAVM